MHASSRHGFTLIHLAIILMVIGIIFASLPLGSSKNTVANKNAEDIKKIKRIGDALNAYLHANGVLPCPSPVVDLYGNVSSSSGGLMGKSLGAPGSCTGTVFNTTEVAGGGVPVYELYLAAEDGVDSYGRGIKYFVSKSATSTTPNNCANPGFAPKDIIIQDKTGAGSTIIATTFVMLAALGADGHGAWLTDGSTLDTGSTDPDTLENANTTNNIFVMHATTPTFDDMLVYAKPGIGCHVAF